MRNILSIMRRDLRAYFTTPIGYIFMMVFITISVGLYISSFFMFPVADMRPYFENLPLLLCVFIPAVTMRVWAEERKENTWEMLLTFPMKAYELVLGKFFAALLFFMLSLFATITVPAMLMSLGSPDLGAIFSGYLGTVFLGAFFLALGIFFSGFFKDQIVAFVVTLLTCFFLFLVGTDFIAAQIDDRVAGLGSLLSDLLGFFAHYLAFTRGVVELADILYFLVWTVLFLVLNTLYIDGRLRPHARTAFTGAVSMGLLIGLLFNWLLAGESFARFDLTEDKIYTVSTASRAILAEVDTPVQVNLYITPREDMPTQMRDLERNIMDKLQELAIATNGRVQPRAIYLSVANVFADPQREMDAEEPEDDEAALVERRMWDKGVEPFNVQAIEQDGVTSKLVYSSIGIAYKDRPEEIIPRIMPQVLPELEYRLVNTIYKLTRDEMPTVALVAPKEAYHIDPQMRQILMQMGQAVPETEDPYVYLEQILEVEKYNVARVEMTRESPLPEEFDTLVVVNPRSLNERQRYEIARALHSGKNVVLAVQHYQWDYQATPQGNTVSKREEDPRINELLEEYGIKVSRDILMDVNSVPLQVQGGGGSLADLLRGPQIFDLPMHIQVTSASMNEDVSITNRLSSIFYLWGTALEIDEARLAENGLRAEVLMTTSDRAWRVPADAPLTAAVFQEQPPEAQRDTFPLMAMVEGQFPLNFEERPAWPEPQPQPGQPPMPQDDTPEPPAPPVSAAPGKLVLLGASEMFRRDFLQAGNLDLFLNSVDAVTLNENLVHVRGRKPIDRTIDRPTEPQKTFWRVMNYGFANLVIAGVGMSYLAMRRRSRNIYTMSQVRASQDAGAGND